MSANHVNPIALQFVIVHFGQWTVKMSIIIQYINPFEMSRNF